MSSTRDVEPMAPGRAIDDPPTRLALRHYRHRSMLTLLLGFTGLVLDVVVVSMAPNAKPTGFTDVIAVALISGGLIGLAVGLSGLTRSIRMKVVLGREPWVSRACRYRIVAVGTTWGQPALLIMASGDRPEAVCSVSAWGWRFNKLPQGDDLQVFVAGNPLRWAVVTPPDRGILVVVKRPWNRWWRRRLRAIATG